MGFLHAIERRNIPPELPPLPPWCAMMMVRKKVGLYQKVQLIASDDKRRLDNQLKAQENSNIKSHTEA